MAERFITTLESGHLIGFRPFMELDSPQSITYLNRLLREIIVTLNALLKQAGGNLEELVTLGIIYCFEFTGDGATKEWEIDGVILTGSNPIVALNGITQSEGSGHFTWSTPTPTASRIAFTQAPRNGAKGQVFYVGTQNS